MKPVVACAFRAVPVAPSVSALLWPEALLDLGNVERRSGLEMIATAVRTWSPARAEYNWRMALKHLDWRWRFDKLREALRVHAPRLDAELTALRLAEGNPASAAARGTVQGLNTIVDKKCEVDEGDERA